VSAKPPAVYASYTAAAVLSVSTWPSAFRTPARAGRAVTASAHVRTHVHRAGGSIGALITTALAALLRVLFCLCCHVCLHVCVCVCARVYIKCMCVFSIGA